MCTSSGNKQKVRHFRKDCVSTLQFSQVNSTHKEFADHLSSVPCFASNQQVHCLLGLPNETTSSVTEPACSSYRPTSLTLGLNKQHVDTRYSYFTQFPHTMFIESVFSKIKDFITVNSDTNHLKLNSLKYLLVCN